MKWFCFELFGDGKYGLFWVKKLIEKWYLLVTEMFLFWTFWWWEIRSFFSKKIDGKMIFTWSFWALHDISGLGNMVFRAVIVLLSKYKCGEISGARLYVNNSVSCKLVTENENIPSTLHHFGIDLINLTTLILLYPKFRSCKNRTVLSPISIFCIISFWNKHLNWFTF